MKLLMITSRNIDRNGGENALIMGRHMALYQQYGIETDIIFLHKDTDSKSTTCYEGIKYLDAKKETISLTVESLLVSGKYSGLVTSGFYNTEFTGFIRELRKKVNFVVIIDIHATIREIYEYCKRDFYYFIGTRYLYLKKKKRFIDALSIADSAFVVSDEEIIEVNSFLPNNHISFIRIRCGCYKEMDIENYDSIRKHERKKLGIDNGELALVYSGSKDRWQKFDETVDLFKKIKKVDSNVKFAFYMNLDEKSKEDVYSKLGRKSVVIRWVSPEDMKRELTAYDIGVMLRDNSWTNKVAFPNKFSDYLSSGLHLCMPKAVVDPCKLLEKYDIKFVDDTNIIDNINQIAEVRKDNLVSYISDCKKIVDRELLYEKQVKDNCVGLIKQLSEINRRD